jgi:hypothetical protein
MVIPRMSHLEGVTDKLFDIIGGKHGILAYFYMVRISLGHQSPADTKEFFACLMVLRTNWNTVLFSW